MSVGRLALLLTSPRVAPGLLSHSAWEAVRSSSIRLARTLDDPLVEALDESGFSVEEVGDAAPPELARRLVDLATAAPVLWLGSSDGDPGLADAVAAEVSRLESPPDVEVNPRYGTFDPDTASIQLGQPSWVEAFDAGQ